MTFTRILCAIGLHSGPVEPMGRVWTNGRFGTEYHNHCCGRVKVYWDKRKRVSFWDTLGQG